VSTPLRCLVTYCSYSALMMGRLFVQRIYASFLALSHPSEIGKDFWKKTDVMRQSLQKIEHGMLDGFSSSYYPTIPVHLPLH